MTDIKTTKAAKPRARAAKTPAAVTAVTLPPTPVPKAAAIPTKSATVIKLLLRTKGATAMELIAATDWQPHSLRAFLSGLRKKGRVIAREARKNGEAAHRIIAVATDAAGEDDTAAESGTPVEDGATVVPEAEAGADTPSDKAGAEACLTDDGATEG